jgi:hypothetical protein
MTGPLYDFYLGALGAEIEFAPRTEFSARMASFYCRSLMALETLSDDTPALGQLPLFGEAA